MAGKAFGGLIAKPQFQVVAVRTDQTHPALQFGVPPRRQRRQQSSLEKLPIGVPRA